MTDESFGDYLVNVQERDIDLLLMEEFHVSRDFVSWFSNAVGVDKVEFDGAWHSVTDADGETDLLVRVISGGKRIGILIENKISAPEQDQQGERYHLRAARAQNAGRFNGFVVCMCAPQAYLAGLSDTSLYEFRISYEEIARWFARSEDGRSRWRRGIMEKAVAKGKRDLPMVVNETVSRFHQEFFDYILVRHPELVMRRPTPKGNKSNWILFKGVEFPKGVSFHIKMDQRSVELGFIGRLVSELRAAAVNLPADIRVAQKGGTASLCIAVPLLDRSKPLDQQQDQLLAVMAAVERLRPFAMLLTDTARP